MDNKSNNIQIAWNIFRNLIYMSDEILIPVMTHPCDEQYDCLTLLKEERSDKHDAIISINLNGNAILVNNEIFQYNSKMSENELIILTEKILSIAKIRTKNKINVLPSIEFIIELLSDKEFAENIIVDNAWYDGTYKCKVNDNIRTFKYYPVKQSDNLYDHIDWWTISFKNKILAICNFKTHVLIDLTSNHYNLKTENKKALSKIKSLIKLDEFYNVVQETQQLLFDNDEWRERYSTYAKSILENKEFIASVRGQFQEWSPLYLYLNITNAKKAINQVMFELRYLGQTVADLKAKNNKLITFDTQKYNEFNEAYFDCQIKLINVAWDGKEAKAFRSFFKNREYIQNANSKGNKNNEEHRLESLLLYEFSKKKNKILNYIQPIKVATLRFPMPTPLSASNHKKIKYSGYFGGGIDIFARTGMGGKNTNLCIIELKDENVKKEPPKEALKQAIAYATFIRELLRSESGEDWWKLFGLKDKPPKKLVLFAMCALPSNQNNDKSFESLELNIEDDIIKLHYLYFTEENNEITKIDTSLTSKNVYENEKAIL